MVKKQLFLPCVALLVISLVGCGDGKDEFGVTRNNVNKDSVQNVRYNSDGGMDDLFKVDQNYSTGFEQESKHDADYHSNEDNRVIFGSYTNDVEHKNTRYILKNTPNSYFGNTNNDD